MDRNCRFYKIPLNFGARARGKKPIILYKGNGYYFAPLNLPILEIIKMRRAAHSSRKGVLKKIVNKIRGLF